MRSIQTVSLFFLILNTSIKSILTFSPASGNSRCKTLGSQKNQLPTSLYLSSNENNDVATTRRGWLTDLSIASLTGISTLILKSDAARASGGATAGGVYLLSAKQRYNARVTEGVKGFLKLSSSLESGTVDEAKAFFSTDEPGGWKDSSAAGYLLANAFRRSSSTPPDNLPSVKKWKEFAKEVENLQKTLKKKDIKAIKSAYTKAEDLLDPYLELVELPPVIEMRQ